VSARRRKHARALARKALVVPDPHASDEHRADRLRESVEQLAKAVLILLNDCAELERRLEAR
jgi:hypothetical protein